MHINVPSNWFDIRQGLQASLCQYLFAGQRTSTQNEGSHCPHVSDLHEYVSTNACEAPVIEGCL